MKFYSTNDPGHLVSFREAVMTGLPPDNGLYMPEHLPKLDRAIIDSFSNRSFIEIAQSIAVHILGDSVDRQVLREVVENAISFDAPLVPITDNCRSLELFHGPTLAFKDFAARFMAHLMGHFVQDDHDELVILAATSGDTGSAVANGFHRVPGIRVVILYPAGRVSHIQEKQLTTLGDNITALEIDGAFDDCQDLVKQAFLDTGLRRRLRLTSANSINIARLIPQSFYHAYAWSRLPEPRLPSVFSVPSGNFGNLTAGLIARRIGVPITCFVASTNANDIVPTYLKSGRFRPEPTRHTISNAMDVGNPSNFSRMAAIYRGDAAAMRQDVCGYAFTDAQTRKAMRDVFESVAYVLDPHGAVGYLGLQAFLKENPGVWQGVFLETAHPAKFLDIVEPVIKIRLQIPKRLAETLHKTKSAIPMDRNYQTFKSFLADTFGS